jgi:tetratricopeptide (TPR) repeat protein
LVKGVKERVRESAVRKPFAICALIICLLVSACTTVTEEDLADLQSPNAVAKKEALGRISREPRFPLNLMTPLWNKDNEEKAVTIMLELLHNGRETKDMQLSVLKALGQVGHKTKVPPPLLLEKLKDKDPDICRGAIEALARRKCREGLPALLQLLSDGQDKYAVIWALGEIGDPAAIPTLDRLLSSADEYERYNAQKALAKMGKGKETGAGASLTVAGGSSVGDMGSLPSHTAERGSADKASGGQVSGKVFARGADEAVSKRQDPGRMMRQAGQMQMESAGKRDAQPVNSLALQRKQLLQALATKRKLGKEIEPAEADVSNMARSVSQDVKGQKETTHQVLSPDSGEKENTRRDQQKQGMERTTGDRALMMTYQPTQNAQRLNPGMRGSDPASDSWQEESEETPDIEQSLTRQGAPEKAASLYRNALAYHREGSLQEAKELYEAALEISPDFASAWNNLGTIYMKERNYGKALTVLQRALRITPSDVDPYYNLACLYALQENVAESLSYLRKAVTVDGEAREWALTDADLKSLHGHAEYEKIIQDNKKPYDSPTLIIGQAGSEPERLKVGERVSGQASHARQERKEEYKAEEEALAKQGIPEKAVTLYLDALARHREGSLQAAKELYEAAVEISPDLASAWNNLGTIYIAERNYVGALTVLQRALRTKPSHADPYYNLACLYALQQNVARSLSYLKKAVSVDGEVRKWALTDADLKNLHGHAEYERLIGKTKSS